jgi:hypothetical protein
LREAKEATVVSTHLLVVAGPMSAALSRTVQDRFESVRVTSSRSHSVIECSVRDQSALRGLVTQLWDAGCELLLVSQVSESPGPRRGHGHTDTGVPLR